MNFELQTGHAHSQSSLEEGTSTMPSCVEGVKGSLATSSVCTTILCLISLLNNGECEAEDSLSPFTVRQKGPRLGVSGLSFREGISS